MREDVTRVGRGRPDRRGAARDEPTIAAHPVLPRLPGPLVERPRLSSLLDAGGARPVTVLAAPAGWGKTTLLNVGARRAAAHHPVAWVTVPPGDDSHFWSRVHAALPPDVRGEPPPRAPDERYLTRLADALARQPAPTLLILDELDHVRNARVLQGVAFLLRHGVGRLRLLIAARTPPALPLHRWRLTGELTELGPRRLAFSRAETARYLVGHGLPLARPELDRLQARTGGWPAAVRLATLALAHAATGEAEPFAEHLVARLPDREPRGLRDVLLDTSIVDDVTSGPPADPEFAVAHAAARPGPGPAGAALRVAERAAQPFVGPRRARSAVIATALCLADAQQAGDRDRVRVLAARLLTLAAPGEGRGRDASEPAAAQAIALTALGEEALAAGELAAAELRLGAAVAAAYRCGLQAARAAALGRLAFLRALRGELTAARTAARAAIGAGRDGQPCRTPGAGYAYLALALAAFFRDRLDDAETQLCLAAGDHDLALPAWVGALRALVRSATGDRRGAMAALRATRRRRGRPAPGRCAGQWCAAVEAELLLGGGDPDAARRRLAPLVEGPAGPPALFAVTLARGALRDGDPHVATRLLPPWTEDHGLPVPVRLAAAVVEARAARDLGDQRRTHAALARVRELAEPEGYRRVFGEVVPAAPAQLAEQPAGMAVSAGGPSAETPADPAGDPLTDRELTVLRHLQGVLSNVEIAAELRLSVNTVKTHVRSIYRKLDASRRREAVRRARELRLL
ncbi:LuxR family transcriptional regulator, maltose regulon positive regulatory protein [Micromonospora pattaloongensis]|uniref:LuxR family transcriptional regulator, maltose regulon positive regulatory protein n=1 Tax=Micromonospora pattaloongensis TaxID=405436 RepID=A0A1H3RS15_9ACTN|nr:LuxR C-terminal-related transcriptional regulator [Micromonospora pattaloongensis]SDZ28433.1 LuxR family transcriptional regulator, maltose regulon positive regulatory protein [Micromonospora pattaloongensis]